LIDCQSSNARRKSRKLTPLKAAIIQYAMITVVQWCVRAGKVHRPHLFSLGGG
jgi:hypothetical protein